MTTTTTGPRHPTWQAALSAAQAEVESPGKDSHNKFHDYDYTSAEGMIGATKGPLGNHGLAARLGEFEVLYEKVDGDVWPVRAVFWLDWDGGHSEPTSFTFPAIEGKGRPADKAIAGALTTMTGYWLRGLLNIPRGLDGGISGRDDTAYQGRRREQARPEPQRREQTKPDYNRGMGRPQDQPLRAPVFDALDAALTEAFGRADGDPTAFARADGLALDVCGVGVVDVMKDQTQARKLLAAVQASK